MAKRLLDLLLSSLGLAVLALPLGLVALAIKLDSPGPVFYRQVRVGLRGREFRIHKFRTMTHNPADRGPQLTVGADARITRGRRPCCAAPRWTSWRSCSMCWKGR